MIQLRKGVAGSNVSGDREQFPGLTDSQIRKLKEKTSNLSGVQQTLKQRMLYKEVIKLQQEQDYNTNRMAAKNENDYRGLNESDPKIKNNMLSSGRQEDLADMVKAKLGLDATADTKGVMEGLTERAKAEGVSINLLNNYLQNGDMEFVYQMGLQERPEETNYGDIAKGAALATAGTVGAGLLAEGVGKTLSWGGRKIYDLPIDSSIEESRSIQRLGASKMDAEAAVEDAKAAVKEAKTTGEGLEEAEKALKEATDNLDNVKGKSVRTVADTAMDYNVGGGIIDGWTAESRGMQARHQANQIFKKTINPALENSKQTINVKELIDELGEDIKEIAKNDPDKEKAYSEALQDLKKSYKDKKFAKYSMKDSQTLKSGLQGRTPQKYFKGKEITNELQELKGKLSSKLTNAIHTNLTKELGENSAKLYKDYANLTEYADSMAKAATNGQFKGGFGNFWSSAFHAVTDGASAKVGLLNKKVGDFITPSKSKVGGKIVDSVGDLWNSVVKNPKAKDLIKNAGKGLKVEDPVGLIELGQLIPGTIGDLFDIAAQTPAVAVDEMITEVQSFKDEWNAMSDEERMEDIKREYREATGNELSDESAKATYDAWLKKHPSGKYGFRDSVNDVEIRVAA